MCPRLTASSRECPRGGPRRLLGAALPSVTELVTAPTHALGLGVHTVTRSTLRRRFQPQHTVPSLACAFDSRTRRDDAMADRRCVGDPLAGRGRGLRPSRAQTGQIRSNAGHPHPDLWPAPQWVLGAEERPHKSFHKRPVHVGGSASCGRLTPRAIMRSVFCSPARSQVSSFLDRNPESLAFSGSCVAPSSQ